jgi:hypothetical protein
MGVPLGIGVASLETLIKLARDKTAFGTVVPLLEQESIQLEVALATTGLQAAKAYARDSISSLWASVPSGQPATIEQRAQLRMACWNTGDAGEEVVPRMHTVAGSTAVIEDHSLRSNSGRSCGLPAYQFHHAFVGSSRPRSSWAQAWDTEHLVVVGYPSDVMSAYGGHRPSPGRGAQIPRPRLGWELQQYQRGRSSSPHMDVEVE